MARHDSDSSDHCDEPSKLTVDEFREVAHVVLNIANPGSWSADQVKEVSDAIDDLQQTVDQEIVRVTK